jgi:hypothetical protein
VMSNPNPEAEVTSGPYPGPTWRHASGFARRVCETAF